MTALVTKNNSIAPEAEAYRTLRTNLSFFNIDNSLKCIAITSSNMGEGKSTTMSNLAISIAQNGKKVLLVDCDLRRPNIHKIFRLSNNAGLTNLLLSEDNINDCIKKSEIENLFILPCGVKPPNPAELLGTEKMEKLLETLKSTFDIVLLDCPPVLPVSDAKILAPKTDGVILLCAYGITEKLALEKAKHELEKVKAPLIGSILTKIPQDAKGYYNNYAYEENGKHTKKKKRKFLNL